MRISKKFLKSSLIYTLAGALPMASAIILLPFYVGYLSTSDFGALSLYLAFSLFIQILTTYSYDTSLYIHFHEYKNEPRKLSAFVSSAFIMMLAIGMVVAIIFVIAGDVLFRNVFNDRSISFHPYGFLAALTGIFQSLFKVHSNLLQSREKPITFLWSNLLSFSLIALCTLAGLYLYPGTLMGPVGGRLIAAIISGGWALTRIFREFGVHFDYRLLKGSLAFNFYTFLYQLLQWVVNYFDRILMVFYLTLSDVGVYDFAVKCLLIIEFLLNGLHSAFYPKVVSAVMAQSTKGSSPEINRYYHGFTFVSLIFICFSIFLFPWAVDLFIEKPSYRESIPYFPYIALVYAFRASRQFFLAPYGILKFTRPLPGVYLLVSIIKILILVVLVERIGLYGVIIASLTSGLIEVILLYLGIRGRFTFRFNVFKILVVPLVFLITVLVLEPFFGSQEPVLLHGFYVIACLSLLGWVYRRELKMINPIDTLR